MSPNLTDEEFARLVKAELHDDTTHANLLHDDLPRWRLTLSAILHGVDAELGSGSLVGADRKRRLGFRRLIEKKIGIVRGQIKARNVATNDGKRHAETFALQRLVSAAAVRLSNDHEWMAAYRSYCDAHREGALLRPPEDSNG